MGPRTRAATSLRTQTENPQRYHTPSATTSKRMANTCCRCFIGPFYPSMFLSRTVLRDCDPSMSYGTYLFHRLTTQSEPTQFLYLGDVNQYQLCRFACFRSMCVTDTIPFKSQLVRVITRLISQVFHSPSQCLGLLSPDRVPKSLANSFIMY